MELSAYLDMLRRRGWIILLVAVLAAAATFGVSHLQTQIWRATVKISAVPARPDWGLGQQAKDLLRNFVNNINTHQRANEVIARAKLDMTSYDLLEKITVSAEPDNFLIRIDAKDQDPTVARDIALTLANVFVDDRIAYYDTQDKRDRIDVKLVDTVVDPVVYQPNPKTNAIAGGVLGALMGALIVLALEWMAADILATPESVTRVLGVPILGASPALFTDRTATAGKEPMKLISLTDPNSATAEAYRRLRANLTFAGQQQPLHTLLVASAGSDGNKSAVPANLAVAFARVGRRVILADCDLRHPHQHELFEVANDDGVSEFLRNPQARLPLMATGLPCLQLMTAGAPAEVPSDLIASPQMAEMVARLAEEADIVLFDAPPVLLASDAVELATHVDGVLLSITAGRTKRGEAQRAKELLERAGARIVGATLTNVAPGKLQNL